MRDNYTSVRPLNPKLISVAIMYFFPGLSSESDAYKKLVDFAMEEYKRLDTVVWYYLSDEFVALVKKLGLPSIGLNEVIIRGRAVRATRDCKSYRPREIYRVSGYC